VFEALMVLYIFLYYYVVISYVVSVCGRVLLSFYAHDFASDSLLLVFIVFHLYFLRLEEREDFLL